MGAHAQKNDHTHKTQETNYWNKFLIVFEPSLCLTSNWYINVEWYWNVDLIGDINDRDIERVDRV